MTTKIIPHIKFIVSIFILFLSFIASAQTFDVKNFNELDSVLYAQYINKNWKQVINIGETAAKHNIDYFYLRVRVGIAAFELGEYTKAAKNLEKALEFNSHNITTQLYLYDTYRLLGKQTKAYKLSETFSENTLSDIYDKRKITSSAFVGGAYSFSNNFTKNDKFYLDENNDSVQGFNVLIGDKTAAYAGISFNLGPSISLFIAFNYLQIQKRVNFQYLEVPLKFDSVTQESWGYQNYYSADSVYHQETFNKTIKQNEIYANLRLQFQKGWAVTPFANLLFINSANIISYSEPKTINNINYQIANEDPVYFSYEYDEVFFNELDTSFVNFVAGINIEKDFNSITGSVFGSVSNINGANQAQLGLSAYYFLNPRATIYGFTEGTFFYQKRQGGFKENRIIIRQKFEGRVINNLWIGAEIIYGNLNNTNIDNGFIVYNQVDDMNLKTSISTRVILSKYMELFVQYQYINYESKFIKYNDNGEISNSNIINYNYQTQNIIGGLKWKF